MSKIAQREVDALNKVIDNYRPPYFKERVESWGEPPKCPLCQVADGDCDNCLYTKLADIGAINTDGRRDKSPCLAMIGAPDIPRDTDMPESVHSFHDVKRYYESLTLAQARADWLERNVLPLAKKNTETYTRIGDVFVGSEPYRTKYMLVQYDSRKVGLVALSGINKGNRWFRLVEVQDIYAITSEEFAKICGGLILKKEEEE